MTTPLFKAGDPVVSTLDSGPTGTLRGRGVVDMVEGIKPACISSTSPEPHPFYRVIFQEKLVVIAQFWLKEPAPETASG